MDKHIIGEMVLMVEDDREEFLSAEEYEEAYCLNDTEDVRFGVLVGMMTAEEYKKPMISDEEIEYRESVVAYWQKWRYLVELCAELGRKRKCGQFTGYLPRRVNDALNVLSEASYDLGFGYLSRKIKYQIEQDYCDPKLRRKWRCLVDRYIDNCEAQPMANLYRMIHHS